MDLFGGFEPFKTYWPQGDWDNVDVLTKCSHPRAVRGRQIIQDWYDNWPDEHKKKIRGDLLAPDRHNGALSELYVHAVLRALGWTVEVQPEVCADGRTFTPDFLVDDDLYVEVTTVQNEMAKQSGSKYVDRVVWWINELAWQTELQCSAFADGVPTAHVESSLKSKVQDQFLMWAAQFRRDAHEGLLECVVKGGGGGGGLSRNPFLPKERFEFERWSLVLKPLRFEGRDRSPAPRMVVIMGPGGSSSGTPGGKMREKLTEKAKKYRPTGKQFLLIVNDLDWPFEPVEAIFGPTSVRFSTDGGLIGSAAHRDPWWDETRQHVLGVWAIKNMRLPTLGSVDATLFDAKFPGETDDRRLALLREFGHYAAQPSDDPEYGALEKVPGTRSLPQLMGYGDPALGPWDIPRDQDHLAPGAGLEVSVAIKRDVDLWNVHSLRLVHEAERIPDAAGDVGLHVYKGSELVGFVPPSGGDLEFWRRADVFQEKAKKEFGEVAYHPKGAIYVRPEQLR